MEKTFFEFNSSNPSQSIELKNSELLRSCPQPADYTSYKDYESALLFWKSQVTNLLATNHVRLPHSLGLNLFRPGEVFLNRKYTKSSYVYFIFILFPILQEGEGEDEEVRGKDPWETQLVPEEPNPENYNSYEGIMFHITFSYEIQ